MIPWRPGYLPCNILRHHPADHYLSTRDWAQMNIPNYRFSLAWSRLLPDGFGQLNSEGIDFYNRIIDLCLELNITPWITLYHWDLPLALQRKKGWINRDVVSWFQAYVALCVKSFGDRASNWIVLNEPMVFTGAGYSLGVHAPGKKGVKNFLPAAHHAALCQAAGGRVILALNADARIGTAFVCSHIEPRSEKPSDQRAAVRVDALLNRLFVTIARPGLPLRRPSFFEKNRKILVAWR